MLIKVVYRNEKHDMVKPELLNELISSKKIKKFYRSEGWVDIDTAPLRKSNRSQEDPERKSGNATNSS